MIARLTTNADGLKGNALGRGLATELRVKGGELVPIPGEFLIWNAFPGPCFAGAIIGVREINGHRVIDYAY